MNFGSKTSPDIYLQRFLSQYACNGGDIKLPWSPGRNVAFLLTCSRCEGEEKELLEDMPTLTCLFLPLTILDAYTSDKSKGN